MRVRTHPGEVLSEEYMKPLGLSASELARALDVPGNRISDIVRGRRDVSADTAIRLGRYFGRCLADERRDLRDDIAGELVLQEVQEIDSHGGPPRSGGYGPRAGRPMGPRSRDGCAFLAGQGPPLTLFLRGHPFNRPLGSAVGLVAFDQGLLGTSIIVSATAKPPGLVEAPSWRFEAAGSRFYGRNDD